MELLGFVAVAVIVLSLAWALAHQVKDAQGNGHEVWGTFGGDGY
jgi:hypothetical protein